MEISLKWVNELVSVENVSLEDLIEKLTLGGFEVEEVLEINLNNKKTIALDISSTANRSDSLSIQGISLEIAALLNKPVKVPKYSINSFSWKKKIENLPEKFLSTNHCSTFFALTVENLIDSKPPKWLKNKLISSNIIPENNLLDFQNYILLETGYPFEFYDLDRIHSKLNNSHFKLNITLGKHNEYFEANNDLKYKLDESILVIKADDVSIGIAGMLPNKDISYSSNTKSLLIECSIFNSVKIRQQSRNLGLRTNRSAKYEKSIKNTNLIESIYRLVSLLKVTNPNLICKLHTIGQNLEPDISPISLKYNTINKILGPIKNNEDINNKYIPKQLITTYLDRLGFNSIYDKDNLLWKVNVTDSRSDDVTREIDLIEEIGRLHGFNNFLTQLPGIKTIGVEDPSYKTRKKLTSCFINLGLNELIHYSLVSEKTYLNNQIQLVNPLLKDCSNLRSSLLPALVNTVHNNLKNSNKFIEGFEYGHIFLGDISNTFYEKEYVAGIFGGSKTKSTWSDTPQALNWFEAKGKIEQLFKKLNILVYWETYTPSKDNNILHPYSSSKLYLINGNNLGVFGQINPILSRKLNLPLNLYLFEFDFELIQSQIEKSKLNVYKEYKLYPKIVKDLSFVISNKISFTELKEILYINGSKFLTNVHLLDEYRGVSIPTGYTSLCLQLTFQSNERTLQNKEIESIITNLQQLLISKFNIDTRV